VAARIKNKLAPEDEGVLCESLAVANAKLSAMLDRYKRRGYLVSETEDEDGRLYGVQDDQGRPAGIFYIED
jgi:hypothetical protein